MKLSRLLSLSCLALTLAPWSLQAALPPKVDNQVMPSLSKIVQPVMATVVNIEAKNSNPSVPGTGVRDEQEDNVAPAPKRQEKGYDIGSGVILDSVKGYVITNAHLVNKNNTFTVTLSDGRRFKAHLVGKDALSDIAVLQIKATNLTALPFADSDKLSVGDFVIAIGNPYGLDQTVTSGIVSALRRNSLGIESYEDFIQTDASINPGNSGGALINLKGELIGINTAILAPSGGNVGIGFAIPSNMARSVANQIIKYGKVDRGFVGVMMQTLTPELATAFHDENSKGAIITMVSPLSPASTAGLKQGDLITAVNGQKVESAAQVKNSIGLMRSGSDVNLSILRNGKPMTIKLVSANPNAYENKVANQNPFFFGVMLQNYDTIVPSYGRIKGVQIIDLDENTPAWQAGLRPGDIIMSIENNTIESTDQLAKYSQTSNKTLLVSILRDSGAAFVLLKR
ncbi:MAG: degP [Gammaproteobacteria bacterium]|nr:degP [Gammaproteobacteria bacterium]